MSSYSTVVLADKPEGYWRMNGASGADEPDVTGNGHTLTNNAGGSSGSSVAGPGLIVGDPDGGRFTSGNQCFWLYNVSNSALQVGAGGTMTAEVWVTLTAYNTVTDLMSIWNGGPWLFRLDASGHPIFYTTAGLANVSASSTVVSLNARHHLVATHDGTTGCIYLDGVLVASAACTAPSASVGTAFYVGMQNDGAGGTYGVIGSMDECAFYRTALTAAQVANHYLAGVQSYARGLTYDKVVLADSPAVYLPLNESASTATVAADVSGGNRPGAYTGGVTPGAAATILTDAGVAPSFNGSSGYVRVPADSTLDVGTGDFAVEFWLKSTSNANSRTLFARDNGATGGGIMVLDRSTTQAARTWCGGTAVDWGLAIYDQKPHHVVFTRIGGTGRIYVDGVDDSGAIAMAGNTNVASSPIDIGGPENGAYSDGQIQHVAYYKHGLTAAQVKAHYLSGIVTRNRAAEPAGVVLG